MKNLIRHLWLNHSNTIVQKSLFNCHTKGLHSIMLLESPEQTIRLYYASEDSEMYRNYPHGNKQTSIAAHPHHCNITMHIIKGPVTNILYDKVRWVQGGMKPQVDLIPHRYISAIKNKGTGKFEHKGAPVTFTFSAMVLDVDDYLSLTANQIHSVACPYGISTAWLIYEGKEDSGYEPIAYARHLLNDEDFSGLYIKPTRQQVCDILNELFELYID